jgi:UDP-N-acetylmuramoylalanine--D-glutamate ligase
MKSLIYGYGITGKSFERYLIKKNIDFDIFDINISNYSSNKDFSKYKKIYCSPGISREEFESLKKTNEVLTDIDIFFKEDKSIKIGVTGTNRKSTTCFHLSQLISQIDSTNLIGNIGNPVLDAINNGKKYSIIELSSFQLDKMSKNFLDYGILLNIAPDHLNYHNSFEKYKAAKEKILQAKYSSHESDPYYLFEWITGKKSKKLELQNLPFRLEFIRKNIINDSKSTNSNSLFYAIKEANSFFHENNYTLIMCGDPSKELFTKINIKGPREIIVFGDHRDEIQKCLTYKKVKLFRSLKESLMYLKDKENILFSPGYPSGKDYKNFEKRGAHFNHLVKEVMGD